MSAADSGQSADASPLWPALMTHATGMHFFRFCELLELSGPKRPPLGTTDTPADDPVRFRSKSRLGFPGREIDAVEYDPDDPTRPPTIRTAFLGLYGVDARMPSYFIDAIAQNQEGAEPLAAFLDLFHHRIVTQYHRAWRKHHYPVGFERDGSDPVSTYLLSLAGLGLGAPVVGQAVGPRRLLSMLGLVSQKTRTAEGLAGVLQHAVPDAMITVEEFHPVWVDVDTAEPMPLGEHCVLGGGFFDCGNCVRVTVAPTMAPSVHALMPGGTVYEDIMHLLRFYLGHESQAVIGMSVAPALMPAPVLDAAHTSLGYTSLLPSDERGDTAMPIHVHLATWNRPSQ